jgi:hypothetical protein
MILSIGNLVKSRFSSESVSIWETDRYDHHIGEFSPSQVGIILEQSTSRKTYKILINGSIGWVFETFLIHVT